MGILKDIRLSVKHQVTHRILVPIRTLLRQGMTPNELAWSVGVGMLVGSSPMLGLCTWICIIIASIFKLNQFAIQAANYAVSPLQAFLIIPYIQLGTFIFGLESKGITLEKIQAAIDESLFKGLEEIGLLILQGATAWLLVSLLVVVPLQKILQIAFKKMLKRMNHLNQTEVTE
ncbi:DUF2062 domain-containing protein [Flammeovirga sp. SubArs3]|uniref:DUF2062 domain-containing protein n=1 Tax=Flammeovirga sp. SubArs3 TaxID=2995316 RepID=UPI00248B950E|nr:DUF2062 domain-containing protein [Flammeovirga sp. SubArs3]